MVCKYIGLWREPQLGVRKCWVLALLLAIWVTWGTYSNPLSPRHPQGPHPQEQQSQPGRCQHLRGGYSGIMSPSSTQTVLSQQPLYLIIWLYIWRSKAGGVDCHSDSIILFFHSGTSVSSGCQVCYLKMLTSLDSLGSSGGRMTIWLMSH